MDHCVPGIVTAYHTDTQCVDVQPAVNDVRIDPDTGERVQEAFPVFPQVPVAWPRFGGYCISGPVNAGDRCVLVAFDLDVTKHRLTGNQEDPLHAGRHQGVTWFALMADLTDPGRMQDTSAAASSLVIGKDGASTQLRIDGSHISLGASASDFVAKASVVDANFQDIVTAATAAIAAAVPNDGGHAAFTAFKSSLSAFQNTGSTLVKVQ